MELSLHLNSHCVQLNSRCMQLNSHCMHLVIFALKDKMDLSIGVAAGSAPLATCSLGQSSFGV